jgi:hypothetical protein
MNNKEWFKSRKWGVFNHYLSPLQMEDYKYTKGKKLLSWDETVNSFDTDAYAKTVNDMGAGYVVFTMGQSSKYWCAPNSAYNQITGYKTGEACSTRDLIADLIKSLEKYDIPLFLYTTGVGPSDDKQAGERMGLRRLTIEDHVDDKFIRHWSMVLREYSLRYGKGVKGWWIDGCYSYFGYDEERLLIYHNLLKSINPDWLIAYNDGYAIEQAINKFAYDPTNDNPQPIPVALRKRCSYEDFLAGEAVDFNIYPKNPLEDGAQWHILSPLADRDGLWNGWGGVNVKYTKKYLAQYFKSIWKIGGVITVDMGLKRSGKFYDEQKRFMIELMKEINE